MTRARLLIAAVAVSLFAAAAPAQAPPTAPRTPATARSADAPTGETPVVVVEEPVVMPVVVIEPVPAWQRLLLPGAAFLAILVIALFVIRWQRTGELPSDNRPRPGA